MHKYLKKYDKDVVICVKICIIYGGDMGLDSAKIS